MAKRGLKWGTPDPAFRVPYLFLRGSSFLTHRHRHQDFFLAVLETLNFAARSKMI